MDAQLIPTLILLITLGLVLILLFTMCTYVWRKLTFIESVLYEKNIKFDPSVDRLVDLAVDYWRLKKQIKKINDQLSPEDSKRLENSLRRIENYLRTNDIEVDDYVNRTANAGINADIVLVEHDPSIKKPIIKEAYEPEVSYKGILRKKAQIVVLDNHKEEKSNDK